MEVSTKLEDLDKAVNTFIDEYENYFFSDRNQKLKPEIDRFIRELDNLSEVISNILVNLDESKKQQRAKVFLLKARLLDMLPEYEKSAEEFLNKSVSEYSFRSNLTLSMESVGTRSVMSSGRRRTWRGRVKLSRWPLKT